MATDDKKKKRARAGSKSFRAGQTVAHPIPFLANAGSTLSRAKEVDDQGGMTLTGFINRPARQGLNFLGDLLTGFQKNKFDSYGTGVGDQLFGVTKGYYDEKNREAQDPRYNRQQTLMGSAFPTNNALANPTANASRTGASYEDAMNGLGKFGGLLGRIQSQYGQQAGPGEKDFASTLAEAISMLRSQGLGGGVSYDPYREDARRNQAEADTQLQAMYGGLAKSIAEDATGIGSDYSGAISNQQALTDQTGKSIQAGYQSGNDMLTQQAQALGIGEAVANQIQSGATPINDMTRALADNAASGQTANTQLNTNRSSALDYNRSVEQAAQQEGAAQRAQRVAALQSVLSKLDVAEQEANQQAQSGLNSSAMSLAQWLYGNQTDEGRYQDSLAMKAAELAQQQQQALLEAQGEIRDPSINSETDAFIMRLLGYQDPAQYQAWIQENPSGYATLAKNLR